MGLSLSYQVIRYWIVSRLCYIQLFMSSKQMLTRTLQHNFGELLEFAEISFSVRQPTINEQYKHRKIGSLAICRRSSSAVQHLPFEAVVILTRRTTSCCLSFDVFPSPPPFFLSNMKIGYSGEFRESSRIFHVCTTNYIHALAENNSRIERRKLLIP